MYNKKNNLTSHFISYIKSSKFIKHKIIIITIVKNTSELSKAYKRISWNII